MKAGGALFYGVMMEDGRDRIIRFLAKFVADVLQKGVVEGKKPKIVWEDEPIETEWHEHSKNNYRDRK